MKKLYRMFSGAAVAMLLAVGSSQAMAGLDLRFSFLSESPFFEGEVSGTIFGLDPLPGVSASAGLIATSVQLDPSSLAPPVTFSGSQIVVNSFSVASPSVGVFEVDSFSFFGQNGDVWLCLDSFLIGCGSGVAGFLDTSDLSVAIALSNGQEPQNPEAAAYASEVQVNAVPTPAPFVLLSVGLLFLLGRSKRRGY